MHHYILSAFLKFTSEWEHVPKCNALHVRWAHVRRKREEPITHVMHCIGHSFPHWETFSKSIVSTFNPYLPYLFKIGHGIPFLSGLRISDSQIPSDLFISSDRPQNQFLSENAHHTFTQRTTAHLRLRSRLFVDSHTWTIVWTFWYISKKITDAHNKRNQHSYPSSNSQ